VSIKDAKTFNVRGNTRPYTSVATMFVRHKVWTFPVCRIGRLTPSARGSMIDGGTRF
jgi:hypothetical protein